MLLSEEPACCPDRRVRPDRERVLDRNRLPSRGPRGSTPSGALIGSRSLLRRLPCDRLVLALCTCCALFSMGSAQADAQESGEDLTVRERCAERSIPAERLLFLSRRPGGARDDNYDVYTADLDGRNVRRLTDFADYSIRWFDKDPKRDRLVVAASSDGKLSVGPSGGHGGAKGGEQVIAIVETGQALRTLIDTRSEEQNPEGFVGVWHPTFSLDGNEIVFSGTKRGESANLYRMRSDGTDLRRLVKDPHRTYNDPRFGPDGRIVYVRHDAEGIRQLLQANDLDVWLMDPEDPSSARRVTREDTIPGPATIETDPSMSPDCLWVASVRASEPLTPRSILRPASDNVIQGIGADNGGQFRLLQRGEDPLRVHGVPTWQDSSTILSYRWESTAKGWRIIRFRLDAPDNAIEILDLGAPIGSEDLLPLAF